MCLFWEFNNKFNSVQALMSSYHIFIIVDMLFFQGCTVIVFPHSPTSFTHALEEQLLQQWHFYVVINLFIWYCQGNPSLVLLAHSKISVGNVDYASMCSDLLQKTDLHPVEQKEVYISGGSVPHMN